MCGGVAEWLNAAVLKTVEVLQPPGVRIPPPPLDVLCIHTTKLEDRKILLRSHGRFEEAVEISQLRQSTFYKIIEAVEASLLRKIRDEE